MINYRYLRLWKEIKEKINLEEKLLYENVNKYIYLREEKYLEYIETNAKEIQRLNIIKKEYYEKIFI